jgi:hypothetical protein
MACQVDKKRLFWFRKMLKMPVKAGFGRVRKDKAAKIGRPELI